MSVREYIGARYVPVFADPAEWDATRTYEPLTVVTYQGNSYTSRQAVPANIPITNTTYWAQTGNYNAQIEQYRQEVAAFDARIDELEGTVSPYTSSNTIDSTIDNIDNTVSTIEPMAKASQRTVVIIGDSFSDVGTFSYAWCANLSSYINKPVVNMAANGAGFTVGTTFITQLNNCTVTADNLECVIVVGGINDVIQNSNIDAIMSAVTSFIVAFNNKYPNKQLYYFGINGSIRSNSQNASLHYNSLVYGHRIRYGFAFNGFSVYNIQNALYGYNADVYNSDNLHPNYAGQGLLRQFIIDRVFASKSDFERPRNITFTANTGITVENSSIYIKNNYLYVTITFNGDLAYGLNNIGSFGLPLIRTTSELDFVYENVASAGKTRRASIAPNQNGTNSISVVNTEAVTGARLTIYGKFEIE